MKNAPARFPRDGGFADAASPVVVEPDCALTVQDLVAVARGDGAGRYAEVRLDGKWRERCVETQQYIRDVMQSVSGVWNELAGSSDPAQKTERIRAFCRDKGVPEVDRQQALLIYGVLTGFGVNKDKPLMTDEDVRALQINLLTSHATGMGRPLPTEVVRAMMMLRVRTFVQGHSGVSPEIVELLVGMVNKRVHPWVPEQGSVGSSGDLCPLSHLSLVLLGEGYAWVDDAPAPATYTPGEAQGDAWDVRLESRPTPLTGKEALAKAGLKALRADGGVPYLEAKEGLALINGTALSTAMTALAVYDADVLLGTANLNGAATLQAMFGLTRAFDPAVHRVRRHDGQTKTAAQVMAFAAGSTLLNKTDDVQDAYSLRCIPQVHGAAAAAIEHVWGVIENEINAVTDNPLFFTDRDVAVLDPPEDPVTCVWRAFSAGNFHGEVVGMVADYLKIAVAELANISERRIQMMYDANHNRGLPANLTIGKPGLHSGLMTSQYAAASLVSENKTLAHPASVDSVPTSSNAEDHVAMAPIAARHAREIINNTRNVLAIELISALQALDIRFDDGETPAGVDGTLEENLSPAVERVRRIMRSGGGQNNARTIPMIKHDREVWNLIAATGNLIWRGDVLRAARSA